MFKIGCSIEPPRLKNTVQSQFRIRGEGNLSPDFFAQMDFTGKTLAPFTNFLTLNKHFFRRVRDMAKLRMAIFSRILALALAAYVPLHAQTIVVDNADAGFSRSANWFASSNSGFFGSNSLLSLVPNGNDTATWAFTVTTPGKYEVFAWWVASSNRATDAPYTVNDLFGPNVVRVNQTTAGAQWNSLGVFSFDAGSYSIQLSDQATPTGSFVNADAVRLVWKEALDPNTQPCQPSVVPPILAIGSGSCSRCAGYILPGAVEQHPDTAYMFHSDLPEIFTTPGVLLSSDAVIPPATTNPLPLDVRTQVNNGFSTIDDDFDLFLFHISSPGDGSQVRRMTVYVRNDGDETVTLNPRQLMITDGVVGNVHEMESNLGTRTLNNQWDTPISSVTLAPGEGNVIAYSKQFPGFPNGSDRSANVNCFARIRATVTPGPTNQPVDLKVFVVAIPAASISQNKTLAEQFLTVGAGNGEASLNLTRPPQGCELSRACGIVRSFQWRSEVVTLDTNALPTNGYSFLMGLPRVQTNPCPQLRQTADMILRPGYAPVDTVGNYMTDYRVHFKFINRSTTAPKGVDVTFSKSDADIGLAYQGVVSATGMPTDATVDAQTARAIWAGPNQSTLEKSLLDAPGVISVPACGERNYSLRFQILGNASLPFQLTVKPATPVADPTASTRWQVF
jgi:hypothetical protein